MNAITTKTIYLDTSAVNHLYDDPVARNLAEALSSNSQFLVSVLTFLEVASSPGTDRRDGLIAFLKDIVGGNRPVAMPGDLLRRALQAMADRSSSIEITMADKYGGVWEALCQPGLVRSDVYEEVLTGKQREEQWYRVMHDKGRPEIQKALTVLSPPKKSELSTFSGLIRYFHSNPNLVNLVSDLLANSGATVTVDNELVTFTIRHSEHWRFFLAGMVYGLHARSVKTMGYSKHKNPGSIDTQQAIYLATCDVFVTEDHRQRNMMRQIIPCGHRRRDVWGYQELAQWLLSRMREDC